MTLRKAPKDVDPVALKHHWPTAGAMMAVAAGTIPAAVSWVALLFGHSLGTTRTTPAYWLIMAPLAIWSYGLVGYSKWALRFVRPVSYISPLVALIATLVARLRGEELTLWLVALGLTVLASVTGQLLLRRSLI